MKIGYCPTMEDYVKKIKNIQDFEIINLQSAARVLYYLNLGEIDVAVIGRKAKQKEFIGYEKVTGTGYTLITGSKSAILENDLPNLRIDTNVPKEIVEKKYPELKNIVYHSTLQEALDAGHVQLIDWKDWDDKFELLIPVDVFNNKSKKYRLPRFYSKQEIFDKIII